MIISVFIMQYELRLVLESATTGTTSEATTEASATGTATAESTTATTTARTARATRTAKATTTVLKASKEIQTIDDMNHTIAGDGVILGITALGSGDDMADGGLLMQDVVELERDGEGLTLEETLRHLGIPDEFVGVHRVVSIATTALHIQVRGE